MTSSDNYIKREYFEWLYNYMCDGIAHEKISYRKLFNLLHSIEFTFIIKNDVNRAADGIDLRYRFCLYYKKDEELFEKLRGYPCSVLEMLVALSIKCEETIMDNPKYGDRTKQWFWTMMSNLGLNRMIDDIYSEKYIRERIDIFLNRQYEPNGKGGLFYIRNISDDLRKEEIWTQLCWYLDTID